MSFRLVSKSVTLNDFERRNSSNRSVILPKSVAFGTGYVKWFKIHRYFLRQKCRTKNLVLATYHLRRYRCENVKVRHSPLASEKQ